MAISKGQIQDNNGNVLHPETDSTMVISGSTTVENRLTQYIVASGSANTYTGTYTTTDSTYVEGRRYCIKINVDNTGASTINLNSWGVKSILDATGAALTAGSLKTGIPYNMVYNGSAFILQAKGGGGGTVMGSETQVTAIKALTNMITSNSSFESGTTNWGGVQYSSMSVSTSYYKYGAQSFAVAGSTSYTEACMSFQTNLTYTQNHKYYVSIWILSDTAGKTSDLYWPLVTPYPSGTVTCTAAGTWYRNAFISNNTSIASGSYALRFDNNNNSTATTMYFDGVVCIDLTAAYGAGNEPTLAQMNTLMDSIGGWFQGSLVIESIPSGSYTTTGTSGTTEVVSVSSNLLPGNIVSGNNVFGVVGIIPDRGEYQYTGGIGNAYDSNTSSNYLAFNNIPEGYYHKDGLNWAPEVRAKYSDVASYIGVDASTMLNSKTILGITGNIANMTSAVNFGNADSNAFTSSAYMCNGIAYNSAVGAFDIYVPAGYYNGSGTNRIHIPNLLPSNIVNGVQVGWSGNYIQGTATVASMGGRNVASGTISYNSSSSITVDVGFAPKLVIIGWYGGEVVTYNDGSILSTRIIETGFFRASNASGSTNYQQQHITVSGNTFTYDWYLSTTTYDSLWGNICGFLAIG